MNLVVFASYETLASRTVKCVKKAGKPVSRDPKKYDVNGEEVVDPGELAFCGGYVNRREYSWHL